MTMTFPGIPTGLFMATAVLTLLPVNADAQQMPRTTTEKIAGTQSVSTQTIRGTVAHVEGNNLVVRMSTGEIRYFQPPESRRFVVDGRELTLRELKPGTTLTATVTTTTTPVTDRTTTIGTGTVWYVAGPNVIITLPNGENRMYKVTDDYRFNVEGKKATVYDLRKGMRISAEKIVEAPRTEIASNVVVVGQAPPAPQPRTEVAQAPRQPRPQVTPAPEPAPEPTPAPAPVEQAAAAPAKTLPPTASQFPLVGLFGLFFTGGALVLHRLRRR
jgi:hypothetical protein